MNFINAYRNTDGSVTVHHVDMTKAAYQHLYDSVMSEYDFTEFIDMTMKEKDPEKREKLYQKLILETYLEKVEPLSRWCYRGSEKEANNCICIEGPGGKFCVSVFRQNQEYHVFNGKRTTMRTLTK